MVNAKNEAQKLSGTKFRRRTRDCEQRGSGKTSWRRWDLSWDFKNVEKLNRQSEKSIPGGKEWLISVYQIGVSFRSLRRKGDNRKLLY